MFGMGDEALESAMTVERIRAAFEAPAPGDTAEAALDAQIVCDMKARARIAACFGGRGHLEGHPPTCTTEAGGTRVRRTSVVVHPGAQVRVVTRAGTPGCEGGDVVAEGRAGGFTCEDIISLRWVRPALTAKKEELLATNPGANRVESTMHLVKYGAGEVVFSRGHCIYNDDVEDYGQPAPAGYRGEVNV